MLTGLNSPYARHTGVRGLPVPLWRFGGSLLFAVVVVGRFISEFVLRLSPLYSRVLLLDNRQRRACLERDPVTLQQFVGWRVVLRYLALFGLVLVALRFLTSAMLPIIAVTVVSEARALQCVQGSFGLRC